MVSPIHPLAFEQGPQDEEKVGGALGEATGEVGIPLVAKRDIDSDPVAFLSQSLLEVPADAKKHLEFVTRLGDVLVLGKGG